MASVTYAMSCVIIMMYHYCLHTAFSEIATVATLSDIDDGSLYFEIIEPAPIRFTYKMRISKYFGKPFPRLYTSVDLVPSNPYEACSPIIDPSLFHNKVILVKRGGCSFITKAYMAQNAGALAVIVTDYDADNDAAFIHMAGDFTDRPIKIPAAFLLGKDGDMILRTLRELSLPRAVINIPINITNVDNRNINLPPWVIW